MAAKPSTANGTLTDEEIARLRARIDSLLKLPPAGKHATSVRVWGRGGKAYVEIELDNGERIVLDPLGAYSSPTRLNFEISGQVGAKPRLKADDVQDLAAVIYRLGEHHEATEAADRAWELGADYLRDAVICDVDVDDQESRWRAFSHLARKDTKHTTVLLDGKTGNRYVRVEWLITYLRGRCDPGEAPKMCAALERSGWRRRGTEGRVKATDPAFPRTLQWAFLIVPEGWEK